jgi:hypothetical protein
MSSPTTFGDIGVTRTAATKFTVAQVGYTGTDEDRDRWMAASIWLMRNKDRVGPIDFCDGLSFQHDPIDLRGHPHRDFLAEQAPYDIVVTHNLWGTPGYVADGPTECSPLHSSAAWKRRLEGSGARYIFLFGADFNAPNLDHSITGYECLHVAFHSLLNVFILGSCAGFRADAIESKDMSRARAAALPALSMNRVLDLSYADVTSSHLAQLGRMPHLEELRLVGTAVSDEEMVDVVQATQLKILVLDDTRISNSTLFLLKRMPHLECLSLDQTKLDDQGISQLRELTGLKWLSLIGTGITDAGLRSLHAMSNLEWLCLVDTKVTASGIEEIRRVLPQCAVRGNVG